MRKINSKSSICKESVKVGPSKDTPFTQKLDILPIRAAFADREKNRKSLVSGGGSGGGGGRAGVVAAADSKMVSADSKMVSADSKLVSANFTGHLQQFYFTSSRNSFFTKIKEI